MTQTAPPDAIASQAFPNDWPNGPEPFLRARDKTVDRLLHGVFHHRRIQLLSGPAGAGKRTALRRLRQRLDGRRTLVNLDADARDGAPPPADRLADRLAAALAETTPGDGPLRARLEELDRRGHTVLLLLEAGDRLPNATLQTLCDWCRDPSLPLSVVLSCAPSLAAELAEDRRYWEPVPLHPLSRLGTARYLRGRLQRAGVQGDGPFTTEQVEEIHRRSGGWPGLIDPLARERVEQSDRRLLRTARRGSRGRLLLWIALLAAMLLAWQHRSALRLDAGELLQRLGQQLAAAVAPLPSAPPQHHRPDPTPAHPASLGEL